MGTGAEAYVIPALVSAVGTAVTYTAAQKANNERKQALVNGINSQADVQKKANALTDDFVTKTYDPATRAANYESTVGDRTTSFDNLLSSQAAAGEGAIDPAATGALSDAYTQKKATATAAAASKTRTLASLLARSGAGGGLAGNEAVAHSGYSSDLLGYGQSATMANNLTGVQASNAENSGNTLALLGGLLSGTGRALPVGKTTAPYETPSLMSYGSS